MLHRSRLLVFAAALLTGLLIAIPAASQYPTGPPCAERDVIIELLLTHYGERIEARGLSNSGYVLEIYVGPTSTWTIVATPPAGQSCVLAQGIAWDVAKPRDHSARR